jgi:hypothetical protein
MAFLSDTIDVSKLRYDQFNLIAAGCGTGKSHWVINHLLTDLGDVRPCDVMFVTSRSITRDQQARNSGISAFNPDIVDYWNDGGELQDHGLTIMTYDRLVKIIKDGCQNDVELLSHLKVVVFDECHTLFSDLFIGGVDSIKEWVREVIYRNGKLFIGMTATPAIIAADGKHWGIPIVKINAETVVRYRAKHLICTNFKTIPYLIGTNRLPGKTMIMCSTVADCFTLQDQMQNAAVIISPHAKGFTEEMRQIRAYIVKNESLPDFFIYTKPDGTTERRPLDVLIATSTLREGVTLREESGVRNIISCIPDELHVTQFAGRCRYDLDNLIVAQHSAYSDKDKTSAYVLKSREKFKQYIENKECAEWFNSISHLVKHDIYGVRKFFLGTDDMAFINYINRRWLVPKGVDADPYRIWKIEDKNEIIAMANKCRLFSLWPYEVSFIKVIKLLQNGLGYEVDSGRVILGGSKQTYKLVVSYDAESATYVPQFPTIAEGFDDEEE